jgi:uridine kinase
MRYSRRERSENQTIYNDHRHWYNIDNIHSTLKNILNPKCKIIQLKSLYNHKTGELDRDLSIYPQDIDFVILEGMYALHSSFSYLLNLGILISPSHNILQHRVLVRDKIERGLDEKTILSRYWIINGLPFQMYIDSVIDTAHIVINNSEENKISLIHTFGIGNSILKT